MMKNLFVNLLQDENGQGMAEYGLILALIAVVVIGTLQLLGTNLNTKFTQVKDAVGGAGGGQ
ncbi:Flp/Fap pilin component [Desulforamulus hydrothermalis Lam5 = DSM 18033]|uniref:Flp/Fap pilin component n=2 Tax=Desulforamulus TaxID=2916693 RepID=K8DX61_9FIRM|nr:Flp/Fap pilin component [Desulforamulus hydrothermalis Lam5 = DSM 18033]SHG97213.1 pilus assembly protein Flp/PilA [Desulforamulus hydrothermalis Lam5 = DSM 18033]